MKGSTTMYDHESPHHYLCDCLSCRERNARQAVRIAEMRERMYQADRSNNGNGFG